MWWAEPEDALFNAVEALAGFCDRIVAVNGRWAEPIPFPDEGKNTHHEVEAIYEGALAADLDATVHVFAGPIVGEVFHRNFAIELAKVDADWIYLMDADERIVSVGEDSRDRLEGQIEDVGTVEFHTVDGPEQPATGWENPGETTEQRRIFRTRPDLHYDRHHWWLRTMRLALWGQIPGVPFAPANKIDIRVEHRTCVRSEERWKQKREYIAVRDPADKKRGYEL
jgi:hypothetical protein